MAIAAAVVCERFDDEAVATDDVSEPWQVFDWYIVEGLVRTARKDETGGQFTLKEFHSQKTAADDSGWQQQKIILKPLNPDYEPIVLELDQEGDVMVVAELVRSLDGA